MTTHVHYDLEAERARISDATARMFAAGLAAAPESQKGFIRAQQVMTRAAIDFHIARLQLVNEGLSVREINQAATAVLGSAMHNTFWRDDAQELSMKLIAGTINIAIFGPPASASHVETVSHHPMTGGTA